MSEVRIRPFREGDENAMADVFFASVREAALADYTPEQVHAWAPRRPDPSEVAERAGDGRRLFVAVSADGQVVAYADLEHDGHIDHLYCSPDWIGRGVASKLYGVLEAEARAQGVPRLYVEASEAARRLFEHKGFHVDQRNDLVRDGVALHNFDMHKDL